MGEAICATMHFGCLHTSPACNTPSASCSSLHTRMQLQRRAYWLLEADGNLDLVLVHYLHIMKPPQHASNDIITSAVLSEHSRSRGTTPSAALPQSCASPDRPSGSGSPLNLPSKCERQLAHTRDEASSAWAACDGVQLLHKSIIHK